MPFDVGLTQLPYQILLRTQKRHPESWEKNLLKILDIETVRDTN